MPASRPDTRTDEDTDAGPAEARAGKARLCLATGEVTPAGEMIRFVVAPDGAIVPDIACKLPGRGAWISAKRSALQSAIERKSFGRAFRGKGKADRELPGLVDQLLERVALESLSLANKAGAVVTGFEKVKKTLPGGKVAALVHGSDAGDDGTRKLNAIGGSPDSPAPAAIGLFSGEQLDMALGRSNVVHAALLDHAACRAFLANCLRLERWRETSPRAKHDAAHDQNDTETGNGLG
jgi:predicted RNA-binding protein YlxR (DUF448 family)